MKFNELGRIGPIREHVIVFVCEDDLLAEEARPVFADAFGGEWVFERLTLREFEALDGRELVERALSPPLFGPARALIVAEAGKVTKKKLEVLEEVAALEASSLKIILGSSARKLPRSLSGFRSIVVDPLRPGDAVRWLRQRYEVRPEVAQYLVDALGSELRPLSAEMEKLMAYVREARPVEIRDVDSLTLRSEQFSPFDLDDAVMEGDYRKAVRIADAMVEEGLQPLVVLARVARVWRQLFVGKVLSGSRPGREIAAAAGVPHWKAQALLRGCQRVSAALLANGFGLLLEADQTLKSAPTDKVLVLDLLLWRLLGTEGTRPDGLRPRSYSPVS